MNCVLRRQLLSRDEPGPRIALAPTSFVTAIWTFLPIRYFEQITLPATCAPGHEELSAIAPAKDRKSVESIMVSDPAAMGSTSAVREGRPVPMQGAIRVWPASALASSKS
jgi:hypothetical protein